MGVSALAVNNVQSAPVASVFRELVTSGNAEVAEIVYQDPRISEYLAVVPSLEARFARGDTHLGEGGVATVTLENRGGQLVAVKRLNLEAALTPGILDGFKAEARIMQELDNPHVLRALSARVSSLVDAEIVAEAVAGDTLENICHKLGPLSLADAVNILSQVADGLSSVHRLGHLHRDLRPDNIMLAKDGSVKVIDFGYARTMAKAAELHNEDDFADSGTLGHFPPEYYEPALVTDARYDLYQLTLMLYRMITGKELFEGNRFGHSREHEQVEAKIRASNLSNTLKEFFISMLSTNPKERRDFEGNVVADCEAFTAALRQLLTRKPVAARPRLVSVPAGGAVSDSPRPTFLDQPPAGAAVQAVI